MTGSEHYFIDVLVYVISATPLVKMLDKDFIDLKSHLL